MKKEKANYMQDNNVEQAERIKVTEIDIIVNMISGKPYYEIKYKKVGEDYYHIGYSSYKLENVLVWRDEYFDIAKECRPQTNADRIRSMSDKELAEFISCPHMVNWKKGKYDTCIHPNGKDGCKKCMLEWLKMEENNND